MKYLLLALGGYVLYEWWQSSQTPPFLPSGATGATLAPDLGQGYTGTSYGEGGTTMPTLPLPAPVDSSGATIPGAGTNPAQTPTTHPPIMTAQAAFVPAITMRHVAALSRLFR